MIDSKTPPHHHFDKGGASGLASVYRTWFNCGIGSPPSLGNILRRMMKYEWLTVDPVTEVLVRGRSLICEGHGTQRG